MGLISSHKQAFYFVKYPHYNSKKFYSGGPTSEIGEGICNNIAKQTALFQPHQRKSNPGKGGSQSEDFICH